MFVFELLFNLFRTALWPSVGKEESGSFRPLSRSLLSRFAHFPFRPESFRPLFRSLLSRFAHFPVRPRVDLPSYKILFLVVLFRSQK